MAFLKNKTFSFFFTLLLSFSTLFTISTARKFEVGGSGAWIPNPPENYQSWAQKSRFLVHDTIYFSYAKGADSVVEVNKADYDLCNSKNPIKRVDDGDSEISLDRSGPFYFISGNEDNCKKGQKLNVVVLSVRTMAPPPYAAAPVNSPPGMLPPPSGAHSPKSSSSPVSPVTTPPGSMSPKSSSSPGSPTTSPPAPTPPKSTSPISPSSAPVTSPPGSMSPKSSSSPGTPMTSPPAPMAPKSSAPGSMAPVESPTSGSFSPSANSPSMMGPSATGNAPAGSNMGPSGNGPSASGDLNAPAEARGGKKNSANGGAVLSVITVLSLVLTILMSV
ncbi:unnamed protein product [Cochlearia groenlandica]